MSEEPKIYKIPISKKFILRENGVNDEDISGIQSDEDADALIAHLKEKKTNEVPPKADPNNKMVNAGSADFTLPEPKPPTDNLNLTVADRLKPARINNFMNNRWGEDARLMRVFTNEYPEGRVI